MNKQYILEIAIFTVKENCVEDMPKIRQAMCEALKTFPGFIKISNLTPAGNSHDFADLVTWDNLDYALSAAKAFETSNDKRLMDVMYAIQEVKFMGHFTL